MPPNELAGIRKSPQETTESLEGHDKVHGSLLLFAPSMYLRHVETFSKYHMTDCCPAPADKTSHPNRHRCPVNGIQYAEVSTRTIAHHIKEAWNWDSKGLRYFHCTDPACDVAYFADDDSLIMKSQLRTAIKEPSDDQLICHCFGVTKIAAKNPSVRRYVVQQTSRGQCSCATSNPSGRCCLADFPAE